MMGVDDACGSPHKDSGTTMCVAGISVVVQLCENCHVSAARGDPEGWLFH